jgi:hypothetical protein
VLLKERFALAQFVFLADILSHQLAEVLGKQPGNLAPVLWVCDRHSVLPGYVGCSSCYAAVQQCSDTTSPALEGRELPSQNLLRRRFWVGNLPSFFSFYLFFIFLNALRFCNLLHNKFL